VQNAIGPVGNSTSASQLTLRDKMEYKRFRQLVNEGEKHNVDFKIRCNAFNSKLKQPKAELAKDICAMANNGYVASYIIVGVSDDGRGFQSVSNPKLTEEHVQSFCKTAILPPPRVKVHTEQWPKAVGKHKGKRFIIIQVGPNARRAFCLAKDFISWKERICYRRNEVWIRRGSTSDLATPEEVVQLGKGRAPQERPKLENNTVYLKLARDRQIPAVLRDLRAWAEEVGGCFHDHRLVLPVGRVKYVWRCVTSRERSKHSRILMDVDAQWRYEHGFLFLVLGTVYSKALPSYEYIHFKEKWGWFTLYSRTRYLPAVPSKRKHFSIVLLTVPHISDTDALRARLSNVLEYLNADEEPAREARRVRDALNENLRRWRREGFAYHSGFRYVHHPRQELGDLMENAGTILDLSAGRLP
jgi:hypothetical protein